MTRNIANPHPTPPHPYVNVWYLWYLFKCPPDIHFFSDPPFSKCEIGICSPGCSLFHRVSGNVHVLQSINWSTSTIHEILFFTEFLCSHYCSSGLNFFLHSIRQVEFFCYFQITLNSCCIYMMNNKIWLTPSCQDKWNYAKSYCKILIFPLYSWYDFSGPLFCADICTGKLPIHLKG